MVTMSVNDWLRRSLLGRHLEELGNKTLTLFGKGLDGPRSATEEVPMATHKVVEHDEWLEARKKHHVAVSEGRTSNQCWRLVQSITKCQPGRLSGELSRSRRP